MGNNGRERTGDNGKRQKGEVMEKNGVVEKKISRKIKENEETERK